MGNHFPLLLNIGGVVFGFDVFSPRWHAYLENKFRPYLIGNGKPLFTIKIIPSNAPTSFRDGVYPSLDTIRVSKNCRYHKLFNSNFKVLFSTHILNSNGMVFHASCAQKSGHGHIFIGPSGAGKSTVLKFLKNYQPLGDDSALVRKINNSYMLFGSPFYEKTSIPKVNLSVPVKGIYFLHQSTENKLMNANQAHLKLFRHIWIYIAKNLSQRGRITLHKTLWLFSSDLADQIPVYDLYFTKSPQFIQLLEK